MPEPHFDPSRMVTFDLARGRVGVDKASFRVLVPTDLLLELCNSAGEEASTDFGRRLGTECGRRVLSRLGSAPNDLSIEAVLEQLGGELALLGLGNLGVERWGRALVMTVDNSPLGSAGDTLLAAVVEGALQRAFGRDCSAVKLERDDELVRLLLVSSNTAGAIRQSLAQGVSWGDAVAKLQSAEARKKRGGA